MNAATRNLLSSAFQPFEIGARSASAAMLAWFLRNVERVDPEVVPDAVCDGSGDKGIDALTVDDDLNEITLYQGKRMDSPTKTQGDNDLKNLLGAARYFATPETVRGLLNSKPNLELRRLLLRNDIEAKVAAGYKVRRLVFVTNAELDPAGESLEAAMAGQEPPLDIWHGDRLAAVAERVQRADLRPETVTLRASSEPLVDGLDGRARLAVALVPALELVKLPGIDDLTLFSPRSPGRAAVMRPADDEVFATGDGGHYIRCGSLRRSRPDVVTAGRGPPTHRSPEDNVDMPSGSFQRVLPSGVAHVRLDLHDPSAQLVLHGRVDGDSLAQLRELTDYLADHGGIDRVRLRLTNITFGPAGAAELRAALQAIDGQLRRVEAQLRVSCAEPMPAAAVPEPLWEDE